LTTQHTASLAASPTFDSLGLSSESLHALQRAGFSQPTPIQARAIPPALKGQDVIGCAATGTGKTAAFVLPILERLHGKTGARGLVLAPTRELALQISEQVERFGSARALRCATLIGGVGMGGQTQALRQAQLVVATPGRLIDHLQQGTVRLDAIEILVLDEADRMLDMGFKPQLTKILARLPRARQSLLFSATMAGEVAEFARSSLRSPVRVEVSPSGTTATRADQRVYLVAQNEKTAMLVALLGQDEDTTLVFTRTKHRADKVSRALEKAGFAAARIHGDRSQSQRENALDGFRSFKYRVLVATDIAARGIDVAEIGHVVNYDLPHVPEDYVHRVGRTARAAASGRASSFASPEELPQLRDIERLVRRALPRADVPRTDERFQAALSAPPPPPRAHAPSHHKPAASAGRSPKRHRPGAHSGHGGHARAAQPSGGSPSSGAKPATVFRGGPRRRR